jgi:hypothetical protein
MKSILKEIKKKYVLLNLINVNNDEITKMFYLRPLLRFTGIGN